MKREEEEEEKFFVCVCWVCIYIYVCPVRIVGWNSFFLFELNGRGDYSGRMEAIGLQVDEEREREKERGEWKAELALADLLFSAAVGLLLRQRWREREGSRTTTTRMEEKKLLVVETKEKKIFHNYIYVRGKESAGDCNIRMISSLDDDDDEDDLLG